jgi:hypothetical protein
MHIFLRSVTIHHSNTQITCWYMSSQLTHSCIHHITDQRQFTRIALPRTPAALCSHQVLWNSVMGSKLGMGTLTQCNRPIFDTLGRKISKTFSTTPHLQILGFCSFWQFRPHFSCDVAHHWELPNDRSPHLKRMDASVPGDPSTHWKISLHLHSLTFKVSHRLQLQMFITVQHMHFTYLTKPFITSL